MGAAEKVKRLSCGAPSGADTGHYGRRVVSRLHPLDFVAHSGGTSAQDGRRVTGARGGWARSRTILDDNRVQSNPLALRTIQASLNILAQFAQAYGARNALVRPVHGYHAGVVRLQDVGGRGSGEPVSRNGGRRRTGVLAAPLNREADDAGDEQDYAQACGAYDEDRQGADVHG
eukprot:scaffold4434_cov109-Isochrysis_galbana.AAC.15